MMRYGLLLLLLCLGGGHMARGQALFGLAAGLNFEETPRIQLGNISGEFEDLRKEHQGYHVGAFIDLRGGMLALRPGVYYLNAGPLFQGASFLQSHGLPDDFDVQYLAVPVDVRLVIPLPIVKPYGFMGGEYRVHLEGDEPEELRDDMRQAVILGNAGLGVQVDVPLLGLHLFPELRYIFGLQGITRQTIDIQGVEYEVEDRRFQAVMLRVGLAF